ncbi:MAG: hypothetical protein N3E51_03480 [Candidatus Micrarchaeota archaeon]|nr:hypothetical protein [Candidatus Micrarchaeota archaeon]
MRQCVFVLMLCASLAALQIDVLTPFPKDMVGGSKYFAEYRFINNVETPYYAYVLISNSSCEEIAVALEGGSCTCTKPNYNICTKATVIGENRPKIWISLLPNVSPGQYQIDVNFSGEYDYQVQTGSGIMRTSSNSGGGAVFYQPTQPPAPTGEVPQEPQLPPVEEPKQNLPAPAPPAPQPKPDNLPSGAPAKTESPTPPIAAALVGEKLDISSLYLIGSALLLLGLGGAAMLLLKRRNAK